MPAGWRRGARCYNYTAMLLMAVGFSIVALLFWVPVIVGLLWAVTFISTSITFSWKFVAIAAVILSAATGLVWAFVIDSACSTDFVHNKVANVGDRRWRSRGSIRRRRCGLSRKDFHKEDRVAA